MSLQAVTKHLLLDRLYNPQSPAGDVVWNEACLAFDVVTHLTIQDRDLSDPPSSPSDGDAYLVNPIGSGAWFEKDNQIAYFYQGWRFFPIPIGFVMWVADEQVILTSNGTSQLYKGPAFADIGLPGATLTECIDATNAFTDVMRGHGLLDGFNP